MSANTASRQTKRALAEKVAQLEQTVRALTERIALITGEKTRLEERARHAERLQGHLATLNERFELLVQLSKDTSSLKLERIFDLCTTKIPYLLNAHYASIYTYDPAQEKLFLRRHSHERALEHVIDPSRPGSLMAKVLRTRRVAVFADLDRVQNPMAAAGEADRPRTPHREQYASRSCIVAPLVAGEEVLGVLNLSDPLDGKPFTEGEDYGLVTHIAELLAIGIRNCLRFERMQERARADSLTGLANHQTFFETLEAESTRSERYGAALTVIMLDIDRFKATNDREGHLAGDHVLVEVGRIIRESIRLTDTAARYGGDEFAVVLPESDLGAAVVVAERIRERVARSPMRFGDHDIWTHVSIGVAEHERGLPASDLVARADQALYGAKSQGGDRLVCFESEARPEAPRKRARAKSAKAKAKAKAKAPRKKR